MTARLSSELRHRAVTLYATGLSLREVGAQIGVSLETVRRVLLTLAPHLIRRAHIGPGMTASERLERCRVQP